MYRPLPKFLTIKTSEIEGLGLFATEDIPSGTELGITHLKSHNIHCDWIRTPLGGFYNHSNEPNVKSCDRCWVGDSRWLILGTEKYLVTIRDIKAGEEILSKYNLYDIKEND